MSVAVFNEKGIKMWRDETGLVEMLFTYIAGVQQFESYENWRPVLVDILSCHEESRRCKVTLITECIKEEVYGDQELIIEDTQHSKRYLQAPKVSLANKYGHFDELQYGSAFAPGLDGPSEDVGGHAIPTTSRCIEVERNTPTQLEDEDDDVVLTEGRLQPSVEFYDTPSMPMEPGLPKFEDETTKMLSNSFASSDPNVTDACAVDPKVEASEIENLYDEQTNASNTERPFHCEVCGKRFKQSGHLKVHIQTHTGERPFSCNFCGKSYSRVSGLKAHIRTHSGERPYICHICDLRFSQKSNLKRHVSLKHLRDRPFACNVCGKAFKLNYSLKKHKEMHFTG